MSAPVDLSAEAAYSSSQSTMDALHANPGPAGSGFFSACYLLHQHADQDLLSWMPLTGEFDSPTYADHERPFVAHTFRRHP